MYCKGWRIDLTVRCSAKPIPLSYSSRSSFRPLLRSVQSRNISQVSRVSCQVNLILVVLCNVYTEDNKAVCSSNHEFAKLPAQDTSKDSSLWVPIAYKVRVRGHWVRVTSGAKVCWSCFRNASRFCNTEPSIVERVNAKTSSEG